jgi:hypothetical protein
MRRTVRPFGESNVPLRLGIGIVFAWPRVHPMIFSITWSPL